MSGNGQKDLVEVLGGQRPIKRARSWWMANPMTPAAENRRPDVRVLPEEPLRNGCVPPMTWWTTSTSAVSTWDPARPTERGSIAPAWQRERGR